MFFCCFGGLRTAACCCCRLPLRKRFRSPAWGRRGRGAAQRRRRRRTGRVRCRGMGAGSPPGGPRAPGGAEQMAAAGRPAGGWSCRELCRRGGPPVERSHTPALRPYPQCTAVLGNGTRPQGRPWLCLSNQHLTFNYRCIYMYPVFNTIFKCACIFKLALERMLGRTKQTFIHKIIKLLNY